jgi:hypothetical protein
LLQIVDGLIVKAVYIVDVLGKNKVWGGRSGHVRTHLKDYMICLEADPINGDFAQARKHQKKIIHGKIQTTTTYTV